MTRTLITATITAVLLGSTVLAGPVEDIVAQFQTYGYDKIEIQQTGNTIKIEGVKNGVQREIVYDLTTNTIIKDESGAADDGNDDGVDDSGDDENDDEHDDKDDDKDDDGNDDENGKEDDKS